MSFWIITQKDIPQLFTFDIYKSESKILTPFPKSCMQVAIRQHFSRTTSRVPPCQGSYGNDDRLSMASTYERAWNNVTMGYSTHFQGTFQEARIVDGRRLKKFNHGLAQNYPNISTRSSAPLSGYKNSKSLCILKRRKNFLELME